MNQFGSLLLDVLPRRGTLAEWVSVFTVPNEALGWVGFGHVLSVFVLVAAGIAVRMRGTPVLRPFALGLRDGTLAAPALCVIGAVAMGVLYVVWLILKVVFAVVGWLATPLVWLFEQVIGPVLGWLATPFVWLYNTVLAPLLGPVVRWVVIPLVGLLLVVGWGGALLAPFAAVGRAFIHDARTSWDRGPDPGAAYGQGIMLGLIFWAATISIVLETRGVLVDQPAAATLLGLGLGALFAVRYRRPAAGSDVLMRKVDAVEGASASSVLRAYWLSQSGIGVALTTMASAGALAARSVGLGGDLDGIDVDLG